MDNQLNISQLDLKEEYIATIRKVAKKHFNTKDYKIFIFGSRVTGDALSRSDIDIGIIGPDELSYDQKSAFEIDLFDTDIPYYTDVVDFSNVSDDFREVALDKIITIFPYE